MLVYFFLLLYGCIFLIKKTPKRHQKKWNQKNIQIVLQILGILVIFRVLIHVIFQGEPVFYPFLEILGGLASTENSLIAGMAMGFLGISEHMQILSIAEDLPYPKLLFARICYSSLGCLSFL